MSAIILIGGAFVLLALWILGVISGQFVALRLVRSTIASMPAELRDDWEAEWLAELEVASASSMMVLFFAFGLRRAARRLCDENGLRRPRRFRLRGLSMVLTGGASGRTGSGSWNRRLFRRSVRWQLDSVIRGEVGELELSNREIQRLCEIKRTAASDPAGYLQACRAGGI